MKEEKTLEQLQAIRGQRRVFIEDTILKLKQTFFSISLVFSFILYFQDKAIDAIFWQIWFIIALRLLKII